MDTEQFWTRRPRSKVTAGPRSAELRIGKRNLLLFAWFSRNCIFSYQWASQLYSILFSQSILLTAWITLSLTQEPEFLRLFTLQMAVYYICYIHEILCVCMCVHMYVYICMCIYVYTHIHTHTHTYIVSTPISFVYYKSLGPSLLCNIFNLLNAIHSGLFKSAFSLRAYHSQI